MRFKRRALWLLQQIIWNDLEAANNGAEISEYFLTRVEHFGYRSIRKQNKP